MSDAPLELKKHVGAVHVKGRLSLLQRKISNVLLVNAYEELPRREVAEHEIRLATIAEAAGFDSNDHGLLRDALEALVSLKIKWNVLDHRGKEEWGVSAFLSQAVVSGGLCRYAYPPTLRQRLYNPGVYATINLLTQKRFNSQYALALYENCVRFRKIGTTGWIALDVWRDLLGVEEGQNAEFKYFNRDVLKPAMEEVNEQSDIRVDVKMRREKRRVVALRFSVEEQAQHDLPLNGIAGMPVFDPRGLAPEPEELLTPLQQRLRGYGLSEAQAIDLTTEVGTESIERNLAYVDAQMAGGRPLRSLAGFAIQAIRDDYAGTAEQGRGQGHARKAASRKHSPMADDLFTARLREEKEAAAQAQADASRFAALPETVRAEIDAWALAKLQADPFQARHYAHNPEAPMVQSYLQALRVERMKQKG